MTGTPQDDWWTGTPVGGVPAVAPPPTSNRKPRSTPTSNPKPKRRPRKQAARNLTDPTEE